MERSIILVLLCIFSTTNIEFSFGEGDATVTCTPREIQALLTFKQGLVSPSDQLSSWTGEDCCSWVGIQCNTYNTTQHVVRINLRNPFRDFQTQEEYKAYKRSILSGDISPSLLELKYLNYLDLSFNDFGGIPIPEFIGALENLRYLSLCEAGFRGTIPHQLGNLTSLYYLNLNPRGIISFGRDSSSLCRAENLQWLSNLSSLKYLDLSHVNLSLASDNWLQVINMLPSLLELRLGDCELGRIPSLPDTNFTSLKVLDLSENSFSSSPPYWLSSLHDLAYLGLSSNDFQGPIPSNLVNLNALEFLDLSNNSFNSTIPDWVYNSTSLKHLDLVLNDLQGTISPAVGNLSSLVSISLSHNQLSGPLPHELGKLKNLEILALSFNSFTGCLPVSIGRLSSLTQIYVNSNKLNGTLPENLGQLSKLESLNIGYNSLQGIVTETNFANLTTLITLNAGPNSLALKVDPGWIPPFQATSIALSSWSLGRKFPTWLQTQKRVTLLDLSNTGISDSVPTWFWNMSSNMVYLNLSHNQLRGELPPLGYLEQRPLFAVSFYLDSNQFAGPLPRISSYVGELDLSNNSLSGPISVLLCNPSNSANYSLINLGLSHNLLSGELPPQCWVYWQYLKLIKLDSNNFIGSIPSSMGTLLQLESLHLENNSFNGELPSSMQNCAKLRTLDVGENEFFGSIPAWLGLSLPNLLVLRMRSNKFTGSIPPQLCYLTSLQVLDIAQNILSGDIPRCFSNFSAMIVKQNSSEVLHYSVNSGVFVETSSLIMKGIELEYSNNLRLTTTMDLSVNNLSGMIPEELTNLLGLRSLNLSNNHLTGKIPAELGKMGQLESLDFSMNQLSGAIPQSMSNLNFLGYLNLSCNNLSGKIPTSTQLQSFNASSYTNNNGLCGPPLEEKCKRNETPQSPNDKEKAGDKFGDGMDLFYVSVAVGFVLGSWSLWGVLFFNRSWRFSYFRFIDHIIDKLCKM